MKEAYLTRDNRLVKAGQWLEQIGRGRGGWKQPQEPALLVLDMQEFFLNKKSHAFIPAAKHIVANINALIKAYREADLPVIFTRHALKDGEDAGMMG